MKLSFNEIKARIHQKPVVVKPRTYHFEYFHTQENDISSYELAEGLWLIPDYISQELEDKVLEYGVYANPFTLLRNRRVQMYGGSVTPEGLRDRTPLPQFLDIFAQRLFDERIFPLKPNHILVNEYKSGEGILPHTDGPVYFPLVSTLSLGCDSVLQFWNGERAFQAVYVPQRSLVLFTGEFYSSMLHSIEMLRQDQIFEDSCGNFTLTANGSISELKGTVPRGQAIEEACSIRCPRCNNSFLTEFVNYRETRISLTIRYVPLIG